jgi:hypothetical protein
MRFLLLTLLLATCSGKENKAVPAYSDLGEVLAARDIYMELINENYVDDFECDALLFDGLLCFSGRDVGIEEYRGAGGDWFRTKDHGCYPDKSGSTISRDMLAGAMLCLYAERNSLYLEELHAFGEAHAWVMGSGSLDRTYFTTNFQNTLAELTGNDYSEVPEFWLDPLKDHQRHVVALNFILRGEARGKAPKEALEAIKKFYTEEPHNALFSYAFHRYTDGRQEETIALLSKFPKNRLPTSADWCAKWLWERSSKNTDWEPCPTEQKTHSGGDFIFLARLLEIAQGKALGVY